LSTEGHAAHIKTNVTWYNSSRCCFIPFIGWKFDASMYTSVRCIGEINRWIKQRSRSDSDLIKYKKYKNKLTSLLRLAEKEYYDGRFKEIQGDISKTWKVIKSILPKSPKRDSIREIKINSDVIIDLLTICNKFNQYFTCIGSNLAKKNSAHWGKSSWFLKFYC